MAPIKWVLHWQTNPEAPLTHILPEACACVESLPGAVREGRWRSVLTNYRPVPVPILHRDQVVTAIAQHELLPRDILGLSFDNHPTEYYFVTRSQRLVVKADFSVQNIMEKLGSYRPQFVNRFEGFEYKLGDFRLRIGKCLNIPNQKLRGIVMEVEYMPLSSVVKSKRVMEDFVDMWQDAIGSKYLTGRFTVSGVNFSQYGLGDHYTPQHTAVQYATTILHINAYAAGLR